MKAYPFGVYVAECICKPDQRVVLLGEFGECPNCHRKWRNEWKAAAHEMGANMATLQPDKVILEATPIGDAFAALVLGD